jgi:hypothetical protein
MLNLKVFAALALLCWSAASAGADSLRCGSRLVSVEALAAEVLGACGEPDFIDRWDPPGATLPLAALAQVEEWYYNFGPSQLLRVLRFQHGRLSEIKSDGYGFGSAAQGNCGPYDIVEGLSKYRLALLCGEPITRRIDYALQPLRRRRGSLGPRDPQWGQDAVVPVYLEEWVYNFGAGNLLRIVTLENGIVTDVDSRGRGFNAR